MKGRRNAPAAAPAIRGLSWAAAALCFLGVAASGGAAVADAVPSITAEQVRALVDDREGKVVVVNFWASWCPPCLREFPAIIDVYERYHEEGLDMIAVSMNSPEEMADIEAFLQTYDPPFPIYLADTEDGTFYEGVLDQWYGEMPMTLVFDTAGEQVLVHKKELTFAELSSDVKALLPQ